MKRKTKKRKGNYLKMLGELKHLPASKCKKLCVEIFPPGPPIFPLLFTLVRIVPADAHNDLKIYIQWIGPIPHVYEHYEVYFLNTNTLLKFRFFFSSNFVSLGYIHFHFLKFSKYTLHKIIQPNTFPPTPFSMNMSATLSYLILWDHFHTCIRIHNNLLL